MNLDRSPHPMTPVFLIPGYGIPRDIEDDLHYSIYLRTAFNAIYEACARSGEWNATIILSGGKTDMVPPYRRTEATEMKKVFRKLVDRKGPKARTKSWKILLEQRSLSTLDNLLFAREILRRKRLSGAAMTFFCETTRTGRMRTLARRIFPKARIVPIDFDQSANRYLDPAFLKEKERQVLAFDLWALQSPTYLKKHHSLFKEKMAFLRKAGPAHHVDAVRAWWEKELALLMAEGGTKILRPSLKHRKK